MKDFTTYTLGQLLAHESQTIRRLAGSILKLLQRQTLAKCDICGKKADYIEKDNTGIYKRCINHF